MRRAAPLALVAVRLVAAICSPPLRDRAAVAPIPAVLVVPAAVRQRAPMAAAGLVVVPAQLPAVPAGRAAAAMPS